MLFGLEENKKKLTVTVLVTLGSIELSTCFNSKLRDQKF